MRAIKIRNRKAELLSILVLLVGVTAVAVTLAEIIRTHVQLFSSDYAEVFSRAAQLKHRKISIADFVFRR